MDESTANEYFQTLSRCMTTMEVTDGTGAYLTLDEGAAQAVRMVLKVGEHSAKVMLAGNGGSAALVSHTQNDLCKAVGVKSLVFTEQPLLTAFANDEGYGSVFERPMELWAEPDDLLIIVSSSGMSENILRAVQMAKDKGCRVITFSGFKPDNKLRGSGDLNFYVNSDAYGYVETAHGALTHFITDRAKDIIGQSSSARIEG